MKKAPAIGSRVFVKRSRRLFVVGERSIDYNGTVVASSTDPNCFYVHADVQLANRDVVAGDAVANGSVEGIDRRWLDLVPLADMELIELPVTADYFWE